MDEMNNQAFEIIKEKMGELEDKNEILQRQVRNFKEENERLKESYDVEKLENKARVMDKMRLATNSLRNFFSVFDEVYGKVEAGEYIRGSDPIKDIIDDIIKEREKRERNSSGK